MGMIVADCPRCHAKSITLDIFAGREISVEYDWKTHFELYCECRRCFRGSVLCVCIKGYETKDLDIKTILKTGAAINAKVELRGYISLKDHVAANPPEHVPANVEAAFREGAISFAVGCYNAAGAMFRLSIDLATKSLLPQGDGSTGGPNRQQRKQLNERLDYLFNNKTLPDDLRALAMCVKDDGNNGAHDGTLTKADAEDLLDFATELFRRMFTEPERIRLATARRIERPR